jgi:tetratricopeptide (TPR) repeat protein
MILRARRDSSPLLDRLKNHPPARRVLLASNPPQTVSTSDILSFSDYSFSLRFTDIGGMVHWAELATILADAVCRRRPARHYQDARGAAWCEKGNSLRMLAHFPEAEASLAVAEEVLSLGTGGAILAARLWELRGSLYRDWRRFDLAQSGLARARVLYESAGDDNGFTRCLIVEAMVAGKNRNPVRAVHLAEKAMNRVEPGVDPHLAASISHTLAWNLVDQGRPRHARAVYTATEPLFEELRHELLVQAHRLWLVAHIDEALGMDESAEHLLRRAGDVYAEAGLFYEEALLRLDLAIVLARQQRLTEVLATIDAVQPLFEALGIGPEAAVARRLRFEVMPSTAGQVVRPLILAARELILQPMPRQSIPAVAA